MFTHTMRFFRHLFSNPWQVKRHFSAQALQHIEAAITASESKHTGEIRFVVEAGLHPYEILSKKTPRNRAIELFSHLNIWDTEQNNGVLIYLLLADRDVEIVADRGIDQRIGYDQWEMICHEMEAMFRRGAFEQGVMLGLQAVSAALEKHFPIEKVNNNSKQPMQPKKNELPDKPVVL
jgi:uncharacterized membrane protein